MSNIVILMQQFVNFHPLTTVFNIYLYGTVSDTARRLCSLQRIRHTLQLSGSFRISPNMKNKCQHAWSFLILLERKIKKEKIEKSLNSSSLSTTSTSSRLCSQQKKDPWQWQCYSTNTPQFHYLEYEK